MILDIRKLLNKLTKKKDNPNEYSFNMEFDGTSFRPALTKNPGVPTINVKARIGNGAEFVGFSIIMTSGTDRAVLSSNGLFINAAETRANTVLLFPSYAEAVEACTQLPHYMTRASRTAQSYEVWACYQMATQNSLEFRRVNV